MWRLVAASQSTAFVKVHNQKWVKGANKCKMPGKSHDFDAAYLHIARKFILVMLGQVLQKKFLELIAPRNELIADNAICL